MKLKNQALVMMMIITFIIAFSQCRKNPNEPPPGNSELITQGQKIFRFDTFGDEDFWSNALHIDKAIAGSSNGGFGAGCKPENRFGSWIKSGCRSIACRSCRRHSIRRNKP